MSGKLSTYYITWREVHQIPVKAANVDDARTEFEQAIGDTSYLEERFHYPDGTYQDMEVVSVREE